MIDQTEALVAIDVNSGSFRVNDNAEETAYQVNLQAAEEISRQIRLRDLGGVIVKRFYRYARGKASSQRRAHNAFCGSQRPGQNQSFTDQPVWIDRK